MATQLDMAEQQIFGWHHAMRGYSLRDLIEGMGLIKMEWENLKAKGAVNYLTDSEREEIDNIMKTKIGR